MEIKRMYSKLPLFIRKNKYVIIVLIIGIALMLLPTSKKEDSIKTADSVAKITQQEDIEKELIDLLAKVKGVGRVDVLLTTGQGEETVYQVDSDRSTSEADDNMRVSTVVVTDSQREQTGLIRQVNPPKYLGAIVVCQGADDPVVRLAVKEAVSKATGLGADCISVLSMK